MGDECTTEYSKHCRERFDHIDRKLDRMDTALRGNGDKIGVNTRLDRLEVEAISRRKFFWLVVGAVVVCVASAAINAALIGRMGG